MGSPSKSDLRARVAALRKSLAREKEKRAQFEAAASEAREQQAATGEILRVISRSPAGAHTRVHAATGETLRVISRSPADAQPVFDAIVASAARLCEADLSVVAQFDGGLLHLAAVNMSAAGIEAYRSLFPRPAGRHFVVGRAFVERRPVHVED